MREIVLDTETTGLDPAEGHRIVEIGCIELVNYVATGETWHAYVNPERDVPEAAFAVHGLTAEFLAAHPRFDEVADAFLDFVGDAPLVIHNAAFDIGFLNAELTRSGRPKLAPARAVDTLVIARTKFPGAQASLDALCRRFGIDNSGRTKHGALLDSELLAEVYLELVGGRQPGLGLASGATPGQGRMQTGATAGPRPPRPHAPSADELARHRAFVASLADPLWDR